MIAPLISFYQTARPELRRPEIGRQGQFVMRDERAYRRGRPRSAQPRRIASRSTVLPLDGCERLVSRPADARSGRTASAIPWRRLAVALRDLQKPVRRY